MVQPICSHFSHVASVWYLIYIHLRVFLKCRCHLFKGRKICLNMRRWVLLQRPRTSEVEDLWWCSFKHVLTVLMGIGFEIVSDEYKLVTGFIRRQGQTHRLAVPQKQNHSESEERMSWNSLKFPNLFDSRETLICRMVLKMCNGWERVSEEGNVCSAAPPNSRHEFWGQCKLWRAPTDLLQCTNSVPICLVCTLLLPASFSHM